MGHTESFKESMKKDYKSGKLNQWERFKIIDLHLFDLELRDRIAFCKDLKELIVSYVSSNHHQKYLEVN